MWKQKGRVVSAFSLFLRQTRLLETLKSFFADRNFYFVKPKWHIPEKADKIH